MGKVNTFQQRSSTTVLANQAKFFNLGREIRTYEDGGTKKP
jgi:hypothetical protein